MAAILVVGMLPFLCGCGNKLSQVTGRVRLDGKPLAAASVMLQPTHGDQPAVGVTDAEGLCRFETGNKKGVLPGDYRVLVVKRETIGAKPSQSGLDEGAMPGGIQEKSLIPTKYGDPSTSGLTVTIQPGATATVDFDLKSGR